MNKLFNREKKKKEEDIPSYVNHGIISTIIYSLKTIFKYEKGYLFVICIAAISSAVYSLLGVYLPKMIIDLIEKSSAAEKLIISIAVIGIVMLILKFIQQKCQWQMEWRREKMGIHIDNERLEKIFTTDYAHLENPSFLDLMSRAQRASWQWSGFDGVYRRVNDLLNVFILALTSGITIVFVNPWLLLILGVMAFGTYKIFDVTTINDKRLNVDALAPTKRKINYMEDTTKNFDYAKDIRLFNMGGWIEKIFEGLNKTYIENYKRHHMRWVGCEAQMSVLRIFQNAVLYGVLSYMVVKNGMSIGNFVLYVGMINTFSKATTDFFANFTWMSRNILEINDFRAFVTWPEEQINKEKNEGIDTDVDLNKYEFKFENVSFKYPGHEELVLKNINLTLKPGMKLAIVGINGAGKTTFTKLLMKLYEPSEGRILLNGVDIKRYDREAYFKIFSPVFQNIESFAMPLWENVSLKNEEDTDKERVSEVVKSSGLNTKIDKFSKGIDTEMLKIFHSDGVDLSGGEKQRLAMSRALYKNAEVIVLDEPTAALDALAEDRMYREFDKMSDNKTTVFISHRLSSTRFCDAIAMFDDGKIIEYGTHDELMEKNGKYAGMYNVQAQYYQEGGEVNEEI